MAAMPSSRKRVQVLLSDETAAAVEVLQKKSGKTASAMCSALIELALTCEEIKAELASAGVDVVKKPGERLRQLIEMAKLLLAEIESEENLKNT